MKNFKKYLDFLKIICYIVLVTLMTGCSEDQHPKVERSVYFVYADNSNKAEKFNLYYGESDSPIIDAVFVNCFSGDSLLDLYPSGEIILDKAILSFKDKKYFYLVVEVVAVDGQTSKSSLFGEN